MAHDTLQGIWLVDKGFVVQNCKTYGQIYNSKLKEEASIQGARLISGNEVGKQVKSVLRNVQDKMRNESAGQRGSMIY